jgi:hypothetical protein
MAFEKPQSERPLLSEFSHIYQPTRKRHVPKKAKTRRSPCPLENPIPKDTVSEAAFSFDSEF